MTSELKQAIAIFSRGDYFAAAEAFERMPQAEAAHLNELVAALNRIAAAFHLRFERGCRRGSINLLSQALLALEELKPSRGGIDIERLCAELAAYTDDLRAAPSDEGDGLKHRARLFIERRRAPSINFTPSAA
jgi:hypothetical protein